jgi:hypothetical protein
MPLASPSRASAVIPVTLALAMGVEASCLPSKDLDSYRSAEGEAGAPSTRSPSSSLDPGTSVGSAAGASGNGGAVGSAEGEGELTLSLPDAGPPMPPAPASTCASDELTGPNGHCYFFEPSPLSWAAARSACLARGSGWDLVSVRSAADSAFLGDTLTFEAWLGASDAATEGTWVWVVDDQPFWVGSGATGNTVGGAYANWNSDEPNGFTSDCARALPRSSDSVNPDAPWADLGCESLLGAVCELYPAP